MGRDGILDKINGMLEETDYPFEIKDISDVEDFLNDDRNTRFSFYDDVEQLYDSLLGYDDGDNEFTM